MSSFGTVLLTGAAGKIGLRLREFLRPPIRLRSTDILALDPPRDGEETVRCDLSDPLAARSVVAGVDAIVHMAGIPREAPIEQIASANLIATYNVFAAAHAAGVKRVVFGSTNHVVGFYPVEQSVDASALPRPDTLYGASKVFGEAVARLFWDKHGIESVCIRIGSALDKPTNVRQLSTWVSYRDLGELVWRSLVAPRSRRHVAHQTHARPAHRHHLGGPYTRARHGGGRVPMSSSRQRSLVTA
ncbi:NAD-dependent epimerase/dehydratase family protein [Bradyrhizobium sp. 2S1]|uniref:NAD-dependent epimerase/dehydratase family protein n=1 Tax=Bradyrhizobium sp. 2S1 TaxID=1404429 RepID=UPI00140A5C67|nr:NAD(P)-dependent oxidoreductase [Bradyrhizobium sp. 2S1]MCK7668884.1 NAD(P)-dependent oxidoreductase [Bradyrhizobium sp. 2S1]